jgi:hypothetical protein
MTDLEDQPEFDFASDIGYALWRENLARGKRMSAAIRIWPKTIGLNVPLHGLTRAVDGTHLRPGKSAQ